MALGFFVALAIGLGGASIAASVISARAAAKKAKKAGQEAAAVQVSGHDSNRPLYVVYGKAKVGSTVVWKALTDKGVPVDASRSARVIGQNANVNPTDTSQRWWCMHRMVSLCVGPIEEVSTILIDGKVWTHESFNAKYKGNAFGHFRSVWSYGTTSGEYFSELSNETSDLSAWDSTKLGKGVAFAWERLGLARENAVYQGEPSTTYVVKGALVYDPRKDTTNGGSGSHRYTNPATWEWSDNNALGLLDYITNSEYGRGLSHSEIDLQSFIDSANNCDTLVSIPAPLVNTTGSPQDYYSSSLGSFAGVEAFARIPIYRPEQPDGATTQKRLRLNVAVDTSKDVLENVQMILDSMRGTLTFVNGVYGLHIDTTGSPVMSLDEDDIIGTLSPSGGDRAKSLNRATVKFLNANKDWKEDEISWPPLDSATYTTYLSEDYDEVLHKSFSVAACTDQYQAEDLAEFLVRDSRVTETLTGRFGARAMLLEPGDLVSITDSDLGLSSAVFRVNAVVVDINQLECKVTMRRYDASVYTWSTPTQELLNAENDLGEINTALDAPVPGTATAVTETNSDGSAQIWLEVPWVVDSNAESITLVVTEQGTDAPITTTIDDPLEFGTFRVPVPIDDTTYDWSMYSRVTTNGPRGLNVVRSGIAEGSVSVGALAGTTLDVLASGAVARSYIPPDIQGGVGSTNIVFTKNQATSGVNDGEILIQEGLFYLPDGTTRTASSDLTLLTPYEGAVTPANDIFYLVWGATPTGTLFPGSNWGTAGAEGFFTAVYDDVTESWTAVDNSGTTYGFAPTDSDYVMAVGYKGSAVGGIDQLSAVVAHVLNPESTNTQVFSGAGEPSVSGLVGESSDMYYDTDTDWWWVWVAGAYNDWLQLGDITENNEDFINGLVPGAWEAGSYEYDALLSGGVFTNAPPADATRNNTTVGSAPPNSADDAAGTEGDFWFNNQPGTLQDEWYWHNGTQYNLVGTATTNTDQLVDDPNQGGAGLGETALWTNIDGQTDAPASNATRNLTQASPTAPTNPAPVEGDLWLDTSNGGSILKIYNGSTWVLWANYLDNTLDITDGAGLGDTALWINIDGQTDAPASNATRNLTHTGTTAPTNPSPVEGDLWLDTSGGGSILKIYNGSTWVLWANYIDNTSDLTDGAGLGDTALWTNIDGQTDAPASNATRNLTHTGTSAPTNPSPVEGDLWLDTTGGGSILKIFNGSTWAVWTNYIDNTNELTDGANLGDTALWTNIDGQTDAPASNATRNLTHRGSTAPTNPSPVEGDLWLDTSGSVSILKIFNGSSWAVWTNYIDNTNELTDGANLGDTALWTNIDGQANAPASNATRNQVYSGASASASGLGAGALWYDTVNLQLKVSNGSTWSVYGNGYYDTTHFTDNEGWQFDGTGDSLGSLSAYPRFTGKREYPGREPRPAGWFVHGTSVTNPILWWTGSTTTSLPISGSLWVAQGGTKVYGSAVRVSQNTDYEIVTRCNMLSGSSANLYLGVCATGEDLSEGTSAVCESTASYLVESQLHVGDQATEQTITTLTGTNSKVATHTYTPKIGDRWFSPFFAVTADASGENCVFEYVTVRAKPSAAAHWTFKGRDGFGGHVFNRDTTTAGQNGPRNAPSNTFYYHYVGGGAAGPYLAGLAYPHALGVIDFYKAEVLVASFTFRILAEYGLEGTSASRSGTALKSRTFWEDYTQQNSSGFVESDFSVTIGSSGSRTAWDGSLYNGDRDYATTNWGGSSGSYEVEVLHDDTGLKFTFSVSTIGIADTLGIK